MSNRCETCRLVLGFLLPLWLTAAIAFAPVRAADAPPTPKWLFEITRVAYTDLPNPVSTRPILWTFTAWLSPNAESGSPNVRFPPFARATLRVPTGSLDAMLEAGPQRVLA